MISGMGFINSDADENIGKYKVDHSIWIFNMDSIIVNRDSIIAMESSRHFSSHKIDVQYRKCELLPKHNYLSPLSIKRSLEWLADKYLKWNALNSIVDV